MALLTLRHSVRRLAGTPLLAGISVIALALGIGLTATTFSIVYGGIIRGLPFDRPEQILNVTQENPTRGFTNMGVPMPDFAEWRRQQSVFAHFAGFYQGTVNLTGQDGRPERYSGAFTTGELFAVAGVSPLHGRVFTPEEEGPGAPRVLILGYRVWQDRFEGDPGVIGRQVRANGAEYTVIGVMPEGFLFPENEALWLPLPLDPSATPRRDGIWLSVVGRLRDGRTMDQAAAEFRTLAQRLADAYPADNAEITAGVEAYTKRYVGNDVIAMLYTMLGAVAGVLLIACANVANLLLARAAGRTKEIAVRTALGASRRRVVFDLLGESLVLALLGGALGLGIAYLGVAWFNRALGTGATPPFWIDVRIDPLILLFVLGITLGAALLSGIVPAWQASGTNINEVLKDEARGSSGLRIGRFSRGLVVFEIAMSCALLIAAGLMIKSVVKLRTIDFRFRTDSVFTARVGLFEGDYPDTASRERFFEETLRRITALPGVRSAAYVSTLPGQEAGSPAFALEGKAYASDRDYPQAARAVVTPDFFATFGVPPIEGRVFGAGDLRSALPVAVVNRSFAAKFFPGGQAIGQRVRTGGRESTLPWRTIVGVVPDLHMNGVQNEAPAGYYVPLAQSDARFMSLAVYTAGAPLTITPAIRAAYLSVDPNLPIYNVRSMDEVLALDTWYYGTFGALFIVFGAVALFMAALGLYGVMAFSVRRRTQEIGIRMALGAAPRDVLRLIFHQGARQIALGLAIGLLLAVLLAKTLAVVLYGVRPGDPVVYAITIVTLAGTGGLAALLPSRRATRIDPLLAMRSE